jgi:hypothetical protein
MAHFAKIDENNVVTQVIVTDNNDPNGDEGYQFLLDTFGGTWIKTSYNNKIRKRFAGVGHTYDAIKDEFIPAKPFPSWEWSDEEEGWTPPIPRPQETEETKLFWHEESQSWKYVNRTTRAIEE